ncbi:MAG TPA: hypothetical protein VFN97_14280 [Actinospica sp.]|nr:hypothetical protein [Actinospica sp.]
MPSTQTSARPRTPAATSFASCFSEVCLTSGCVLIVPEPVTAFEPPVGR